MLPRNKNLFVAVAIAHVPFLFQLHTLYTQVMLIFILIDVFSFSKGYIGQNYSFSGSHRPISPHTLDTIWKTLFTLPLGITGTWSNLANTHHSDKGLKYACDDQVKIINFLWSSLFSIFPSPYYTFLFFDTTPILTLTYYLIKWQAMIYNRRRY